MAFELKKYSAEIITVGREETSCVDSAAGADVIARALAESGVEQKSRYYVNGDTDAVAEAIRESLARYDVTFLTGSSTEFPEIAAEAASRVLGVKTVANPAILRCMTHYAHARGQSLSDDAEKVCAVPDGSVALECAKTPVCGYCFERGGVRLIVLPGCSENISILCEETLPAVFNEMDISAVPVRRVGLIGCAIADAIDEAKRISSLDPSLRAEVFQPSAEIVVEITAPGLSPAAAFKAICAAEEAIRSGPLGENVYGTDTNLQREVVRRLTASRRTLSTAESCTGGLVAKLITDVPGASDVFPGGIVSYSNEIKYQILGVDEEILATHGAVSHQCAVKMAEGIRRVMGTDWGIGITGIAGPGGGTPEKPVGLVYVAVASRHKTMVMKFNVSGDRETVRSTVAKYALRELLLRIMRREREKKH